MCGGSSAAPRASGGTCGLDAINGRPGPIDLLAGRLEEAHTGAMQACDVSSAYKARGYQAYALHLLGDIQTCRELAEVDPAEASYRQALALAEVLGMRPLQAHCHLSLGTLCT